MPIPSDPIMSLLTSAPPSVLILLVILREYFISKKAKANGSGINKDVVEKINRLDDLHSPKDSNGVPLWYMPRSWGENQKEIATCLDGVAENQRRTLEIIERIDRK